MAAALFFAAVDVLVEGWRQRVYALRFLLTYALAAVASCAACGCAAEAGVEDDAAAAVAQVVEVQHRAPQPMLGDETFTTEERAAIVAGADYIAERTGTPAVGVEWGPLPPVGSRSRVIVKVALPSGVYGRYSSLEDGVYLDTRQARSMLAQTMAHELGHRLGLEHVAATEALMNRRIPQTLTWSPADELECEAKGVCRVAE